MVIDAHAHLMLMDELYSYRVMLEVSNGHQGYNNAHIVSDEALAKYAEKNIRLMDEVGTDIQLLSPRPFTLMHSHSNVRDIDAWIRLNNDLIARTVKLHPDRFRGVGALPQSPLRPIEAVFGEIDRVIDELGFVGVLLNPDPSEGRGEVPPLGDPYWHPLWEKLVAEDVPAHIHSAGCCGRENYDEHFSSEESLAITSIAHEKTFDKFPGLKLMISHGGGSIPYQIGRWNAFTARRNAVFAKQGYPLYEPFGETVRRFYFDTCLHHKPSLELLFSVVGPDRCLFGTERPGSGSVLNPLTGYDYDNLKPVIESIGALSDEDKKAIFEGNANSVFSRINR
jgi:4-oxalmesaconate hydratase